MGKQWKRNLLFLWVILFKIAKAEEDEPLNGVPNPQFQADVWDSSVDFRQTVCDYHHEYDNGTAPLEKALKGFHIRSLLLCPDVYCFMKDGALDPEYPGLYAVLLDEIAKRAEFHWRDSFATISEFEKGNKTFTELLSWQTSTYDVAVSWWIETTDRIREGINFPFGWYDSSILMISKKTETNSSFEFLSFANPFTGELWLMIGITIVISGLVYCLLEKIDDMSDKRKLSKDPIESIVLAGIAFTTHLEYKPRTHPAYLFTFSISLWAMITSAAYTANLASFMVVKNTPGLQVTTLEDAVAYGYKICVFKDTGIDDTLSKDFRNGDFVRKPTLEGSLEGVLNGECKIAAVAAGVWETQKQNKEIGCNLEWIGRKYKEQQAGFATRHDSGSRCTSLISEVIDIHLRDMHEDGFLAEAWENHMLQVYGRQTCGVETTSDAPSTNDEQLNLKDMGGIFIVHFSLMAVAVVAAYFSRITGRHKIRNERLEREKRDGLLRQIQEKKELRKLLSVSKKYDVGTLNLDYHKSVPATENGTKMFDVDLLSNNSTNNNIEEPRVDDDNSYSPADIFEIPTDSSLADVRESVKELKSEFQISQTKQSKRMNEMTNQMAKILNLLEQQQQQQQQSD